MRHRSTKDQVLTRLRDCLAIAQAEGNTRVIADCSLLIGHITAPPECQPPAYRVAVTEARNRQCQRNSRKRFQVGDLIRCAPNEMNTYRITKIVGDALFVPGGTTTSEFAVLVARGTDGPTERARALCSAFWDFLEGGDRETAIDAIEASGFDLPDRE